MDRRPVYLSLSAAGAGEVEAQATGGTVDGIDYGAEVTLNLSLPEDAPKRLQDRLTELSAGRLRLELGRPNCARGPGKKYSKEIQYGR